MMVHKSGSRRCGLSIVFEFFMAAASKALALPNEKRALFQKTQCFLTFFVNLAHSS